MQNGEHASACPPSDSPYICTPASDAIDTYLHDLCFRELNKADLRVDCRIVNINELIRSSRSVDFISNEE